jgi:hypothetical protein
VSSVCNGDTFSVNPATADSWMGQGTATNNYGADTVIKVEASSGSARRGILKFDFSALDNTANISSAVLSLYYYDFNTTNPTGRTYWAYRVTQTGWTEGTGPTNTNNVSWNNYTTATAWAAAGSDYTTDNGASVAAPASGGAWMDWTVTTQVETARSEAGEVYHVVIRDGTESFTGGPWFYSKENASANKPKLVITYTIPSSFVPKVMIIQ